MKRLFEVNVDQPAPSKNDLRLCLSGLHPVSAPQCLRECAFGSKHRPAREVDTSTGWEALEQVHLVGFEQRRPERYLAVSNNE